MEFSEEELDNIVAGVSVESLNEIIEENEGLYREDMIKRLKEEQETYGKQQDSEPKKEMGM